MRLTTIWTLHGMTLRERLSRTGEAFVHGLAHRLPRRIAYWSFIDTGVRHMRSDEIVPEVRYMDLLERVGREVDPC
jgi:hypothetical protein